MTEKLKWWIHPFEGQPENAVWFAGWDQEQHVALWWMAQTRKMQGDHTQAEIDKYEEICARHPEIRKKIDWKFIASMNDRDGGLHG